MASNYSFKYSENAKKDLFNIFDYIAIDLSNIKAAENLFANIETAIDDLCTFPKSAPLMNNEYLSKKLIRKKVVDNYLILYYPDEINRVILIVRVMYSKMDLNEIAKMIDI